VVDLARLPALEHEADPRARALPDQVVVHAGHREEGGDRRELGRDAAVGEDDDVRAVPNGRGGLAADLLHGGLEARPAAGRREEDRDRPRPERPRPGAALGVSRRRSFSSSSFVRIGVGSLIWWAESGVGSSRFRSGPIVVSTAMTISSRIASTGGFVTWAKSCLK